MSCDQSNRSAPIRDTEIAKVQTSNVHRDKLKVCYSATGGNWLTDVNEMSCIMAGNTPNIPKSKCRPPNCYSSTEPGQIPVERSRSDHKQPKKLKDYVCCAVLDSSTERMEDNSIIDHYYHPCI